MKKLLKNINWTIIILWIIMGIATVRMTMMDEYVLWKSISYVVSYGCLLGITALIMLNESKK